MAKGKQTAKKINPGSEEAEKPRVVKAGEEAEKVSGALDKVIHERMRLGIVSALAANERLSFNDLKTLLNASDGNLSVHTRKLEEAGYISCEKSFKGRMPLTEFRITTEGDKALKTYLDHMEALINAVRNG